MRQIIRLNKTLLLTSKPFGMSTILSWRQSMPVMPWSCVFSVLFICFIIDPSFTAPLLNQMKALRLESLPDKKKKSGRLQPHNALRFLNLRLHWDSVGASLNFMWNVAKNKRMSASWCFLRIINREKNWLNLWNLCLRADEGCICNYPHVFGWQHNQRLISILFHPQHLKVGC